MLTACALHQLVVLETLCVVLAYTDMLSAQCLVLLLHHYTYCWLFHYHTDHSKPVQARAGRAQDAASSTL
jgi:hypothetical protein